MKPSMKAAIFDAPEKIRIGEWDAPRPKAGEVLVKVSATGICAGDMYIYRGSNPYAKYPVIGGHEIAGHVHEVGEGVSGLNAGELVVVEPFIGCGTCYACRAGKPNCCDHLRIIGIHHPGGFAEYVVAPAKNIHKVPAGLSASWASFAEPVAIGVQATRRGEVNAGDTVLILGAGPIGLALIEVAKAKGAAVYVTDIAPERLAFAETLGATALMSDESLLPKVMEITNNEGMPCVIEAAGNAKAMESTVDLVANGGRVVIVGLLKKGQAIQIPGLDLTRKEMTIHGSRASTQCFPEALDLLASGRIRYPEVATEFSLWDAPAVFAEMNAAPAKYHKGVLVV
jgi:2-desacetyl-2-hydroxyethyl bacteriochlorophyllide A dehydrogenase